MNYDIIYSHTAEKKLIIPKKSEIMRFLGETVKKNTVLENLIDEKLELVMKQANIKGSFVLKKMSVCNNVISIANSSYPTRKLSKNLSDCHSVIIFSLTAGSGIDRLMNSLVSKPAGEYVVSSIGSALIESYADFFNTEIKKYFESKKQFTRPRFSPGYGDFSIDAQKDIISMTDASHLCGIYLTEALMLTPVKSVTGIIGISDIDRKCSLSGCEVCEKTDCKLGRI